MSRTTPPVGHQCAAIGCAKVIPSAMLMCRHHWFRVPRALRERVLAAYDGWRLGNVPLLDLRAAQAAAVESLKGGGR